MKAERQERLKDPGVMRSARCSDGAEGDAMSSSRYRMVTMLAGAAALWFIGCLAASDCSARPLLDTLRDSGNFGTLLTALQTTGLDDKLRGPGAFTVFAPTDLAFASLPGSARELIAPGHEAALQKALVYHLLAGRLTTADFGKIVEQGGKASVTTLAGAPVVIGGTSGHIQINDAHLTQPDVSADNGVIQVIDAVLLPPTAVQPQ